MEGSFEGKGTAFDPGVAESVQNSVDSIQNGFSTAVDTAFSYLNPNPLQNPLTSGPIKTMLFIGGGILLFIAFKKGWMK